MTSRLSYIMPVVLVLSGCARTVPQDSITLQSPSLPALRSASPALEDYTRKYVDNDLWRRPQLTARDRSIVTISALIARGDRTELPYHTELALKNGVKPGEISEIIAHLAFYSGWPAATSAAQVIRQVFVRRGISEAMLPPANVTLMKIDQAAEHLRATQVASNFNTVSSGVVDFTEKAVFRDLWLRPNLSPRDRSLVTVSALITSGQLDQLPYHLNRAMDNGLTQTQASEMLTQLAFYAGWPRVFSALPVVKKVFASRQN